MSAICDGWDLVTASILYSSVLYGLEQAAHLLLALLDQLGL